MSRSPTFPVREITSETSHQRVIDEHPDYGETLLRLQEDNVIVTLHRHEARAGWLWYISSVDGGSIVGRLDTRSDSHSWSGTNNTVVHFGVMPPDTTNISIEPFQTSTPTQTYVTYSDTSQVYIAVSPNHTPVKIQFADATGEVRYTLERHIFIDHVHPPFSWREQVRHFFQRWGFFSGTPKITPEQQRMMDEARRKWDTYEA